MNWIGQPETLRSEAVLYFSGFPHGLISAKPNAALHFVQLPIADVLAWPGPSGLLDRLLAGEFLREVTTPEALEQDVARLQLWKADLNSTDPEAQRIPKLEIEARIRRFLSRVDPAPAGPRRHQVGAATATGVVAAARYIARHFVEPISVDDVAAAVGWHRDHLMASFRSICGIPLWQYVTRMRMAEAQRLLASTDLPVLAVCHRAGFTSTVRMYDAFNRHFDMTPGEYRRAAAAQDTSWRGAAQARRRSAAREQR